MKSAYWGSWDVPAPMKKELPPATRNFLASAGDFRITHEGDAETIWLANRTRKRVIHGIASTPTQTKSHVRLSRGMMAELPVPLLWSHEGKRAAPIGEVFHVRKRPTEIYIRADLFDNEAADYAWKLVESGDFRCLSVGGGGRFHVQGVVDGITYYDQWELTEVSICRKGANPDCYFEILK